MSEKGSVHEQKSGREIPIRRIADISNIPSDYSTTPGGSIFSTTPGGKMTECLRLAAVLLNKCAYTVV